MTEWQLNENARVLRTLGLDDPNVVLERYDELAREALDPVTRVVTSRAYQRKHQVTAAEAEKVLDALVDADLWDSRYTAPGSSGGRPTIEYFPRLR